MEYFKKHKQLISYLLLGISVTWVVVSAILFFADYGRLHRGGFLPGPQAWHAGRAHHAPTVADIDRIQSWMTFAFINNVFALPHEFLRDALTITDSAYPNITVAAAAKKGGVTEEAFVEMLKRILAQHIAPPPENTIP